MAEINEYPWVEEVEKAISERRSVTLKKNSVSFDCDK
jgi:hypothetical protein